MAIEFQDNMVKFDLEAALASVDLKFTNYTPSKDSLEFFVLMRMVTGEDFEFGTPIAHYFLVDLLLDNVTRDQYPYTKEIQDLIEIDTTRLGIMAARGTAKSTVITCFFPVYCAIKGNVPNYGNMYFMVLVGASAMGGSRVMAKTLQSMCEESVFCLEWFESMRFTETEFECVRKGTGSKKNRTFLARTLGAKTPIRGIRDNHGRRIDVLVFDDAIPDSAAAHSETQMEVLKTNLEADAVAALKGGGRGKIVLVFTPFHMGDPNTAAIVNGQFTPIALPICEYIDESTKEEDWVGIWPEMHNYESVMKMYKSAKKTKSSLRAFGQERMLQMSSEDDRLIGENEIEWYSLGTISKYMDGYNLYCTTDYTASNDRAGDFSTVYMWAVNSNADWFMIDISVKRQTIEEQYMTTINMVQKWTQKTGKNIIVGVEIDGQQQINIHALKELQQKHNIWFTFAKQIGQDGQKLGISRRRAGGDKHAQFMRIHQMFVNRKVYLPEEYKEYPDMAELLDEFKYLSYTEISSKHDDALDGISMIGAMEVVLPSVEAVRTTRSAGIDMHGTNSYYKRGSNDWDSEGSAWDSYI